MSYDFPAHESTRKRRRWGCTCGCVILLVLLAVAATGLFVIGLKSHQPFPRYAMMDQETDGFGVIRLSPDDQGVQEFTQFLVRRLESYQKQGSGPAQAKALGVLRKVSSNFLGATLRHAASTAIPAVVSLQRSRWSAVQPRSPHLLASGTKASG